MRYLLYTFNDFLPEADAHAASLRAAGHAVQIRNARYFDGTFEPCDVVAVDWAARRVREACEAQGKTYEVFREPPVVEAPVDIPTPLSTADDGVRPTQAKRRGRRKKAA